jgi:hypothetical protein
VHLPFLVFEPSAPWIVDLGKFAKAKPSVAKTKGYTNFIIRTATSPQNMTVAAKTQSTPDSIGAFRLFKPSVILAPISRRLTIKMSFHDGTSDRFSEKTVVKIINPVLA